MPRRPTGQIVERKGKDGRVYRSLRFRALRVYRQAMRRGEDEKGALRRLLEADVRTNP